MTTILCLTAMALGTTAYNQTFDQALEHYAAGHYAESARLFEELIAERIERAEVFYNLGNAYYKMEQYAPAIANYERALRLDPTLENAQFNLAQCVSQTERSLARPERPRWQTSLLFWHDTLSPGLVRHIALAAWIALWALLAVQRWRPVPYGRIAVAIALLLAIAFGVSAYIKHSPSPLAVARRDHVPVRFGIQESDALRFELFEGDRVLINGQANGWVRVTIAGGERGWTQLENLIRVGPPYESPAGQ